MDRSPLDGQSAGFASVATLSIKTRTLSWKARSQKTEIKSQRSSFDEYPLTRAASTASESIKRITSAPYKRSRKVSKAMIGANISTGTIWVLRGSHFCCTHLGTTSENWTGAIVFLSNKTAPILDGLTSSNLGSGVNPSVKITTSETFSDLNSIGLGRSRLDKLPPVLQRPFKSSVQAKAFFLRETSILSLRDRAKESATDFSPKLTGSEHELTFELASWPWIQ